MIHPTCNLPSDARTQCHLPQVVCGVCTRQSPDTTCCEPWAKRVCRFRSVLGPSRGEFHYKFRRVPLQVAQASRSLPNDEPRRTAPSLWEREQFILVLESADGREVAAVQADQVIQPFVNTSAGQVTLLPFSVQHVSEIPLLRITLKIERGNPSSHKLQSSVRHLPSSSKHDPPRNITEKHGPKFLRASKGSAPRDSISNQLMCNTRLPCGFP